MIDLVFKNYVDYLFNGLLYSETWEDFDIEKKAFLFSDKDKVLCITSGGSFALNFCLEKVGYITSVDLNPIQNYILELKISAIKHLSYEDFWDFMTKKDARNRGIYGKIRQDLSKDARNYFDKNASMINKGILNNGALYFGLKMMRRYLNYFAGKENIKRIIEDDSLSHQVQLYKKKLNQEYGMFILTPFLYGV